jgi:Tfp pilus assembly protein PilO
MAYNYRTELQRYRKYYQSLEPVFKRPVSRAYTAVIFSFLAVSLFGWYAIRPTIQTILFLRREISDKVEINKKMEDKIAALIEAQAYYQEVEPLIPVIDTALPVQPDAIPLMIQLRNLASRSGVLVNTLQIPTLPLLGQDSPQSTRSAQTQLQGKESSKQISYDFSIAVQGPYTSVRSFLEGILAMRRLVTLSGFSITPIKKDVTASGSGVPTTRLLQLALRLQSYYLVE